MIRQEFNELCIPARELRPWDVFNNNVVKKVTLGAPYDMRDPDPTPQCTYVSFQDGTRAYLDSAANRLLVLRAMHHV